MTNKNNKVLVIIPAYNEADNILAVVRELQEANPAVDYIVINDHSSDQTATILENNRLQYMTLPINLGIGGAVQTGYRYARDHGYDIAVQMDGDGQHDPHYLKTLIDPILHGQSDYCIGSRFIDGEGFQSSTARRFGIRALSGLIHWLTGVRIKDVTSGFRAVDRFFINVFAEEYPSDYPEPKAIVDAVMRQKRITEVPVRMRERAAGVSSINAGKSLYYMIKVTLDIIICRISYGMRRG